MAHLDLTKIAKEPLTLSFGEDETFTIPVEPTLETVYKMVNLEEKAQQAKLSKEQLELFADLILFILSQDKTKDINKTFVLQNISFPQMQAIARYYQNEVMQNHDNPN